MAALSETDNLIGEQTPNTYGTLPENPEHDSTSYKTTSKFYIIL